MCDRRRLPVLSTFIIDSVMIDRRVRYLENRLCILSKERAILTRRFNCKREEM